MACPLRSDRSSISVPRRQHDYADEAAATIDRETRALVQSAMDRARKILEERRQVLERSASRLLETETLDEKDLLELVGPWPGRLVSMAAE